MKTDVIVLGAGAAGLMCAFTAGQRGRRVTVLEHMDQPGKKILISGGGRCNFTNRETPPHRFLSQNPHFCKSALARYSPQDFIALVEKHGIPYHEKKLGQLFCDRSARDITGLLWEECATGQVQILLGTTVQSIRRTTEFAVETSSGTWTAPVLVVATGGLSIPKMGATPLGYRIASQFGLRVEPCRPALVPLTFAGEDKRRWCDLSGVAAEVDASSGGQSFREKMLITHRGLSGPAILQISSYWQPSQELLLDLLPGRDLHGQWQARREAGERPTLRGLIMDELPKRLADRWLQTHHLTTNGHPASPAEVERAQEALHCWRVIPSGTEGYEKAEVTGGGVDTNELSSKTMEARHVPGLYFIGEVVDVTGHLGGYNFQWAWSSGYAAGRAV